MANPFPGVNPYIEAQGRWTGFHNLLIATCSEMLNASLPPGYAAFVEERLEVIDLPAGRPPQRLPDISVGRDLYASQSGSASPVAVLDVAPTQVTLPDFLENPEAYIDIRALPDQELITSIEILSPSNKDPANRGEYWPKRKQMLRQGIHLVEIDLLLEGTRIDAVEPLPKGDFYAFISRRDRRPVCDVYPWSIRQPIPRLPIPLKAPDADITLELNKAFAIVFDRHRYEHATRYAIPLSQNLDPTDRDWATSVGRSQLK